MRRLRDLLAHLLPVFFVCLFTVSLAYAATLDTSADPLTNQQFFAKLLETLGGLSGLSKLGIAAVVVQAALYFLRTPLANLPGAWKLTLMAALTYVGGVLALLTSGVPFWVAVAHSTTLGALQNMVYQVLKQIGKIPDDKASLGTVSPKV